MKILDRYIASAVASAFLFGVTMFMVLLMAMNLLKELIQLIAEKGVPPLLALTICAYQLPVMMVYAFPMAVLLGILLTFGRMSSESEMVAIRAGGISFVRIIIPTLVFSLLVGGLTFWISDRFAPFADKRSAELTSKALKSMQLDQPVSYAHTDAQKNVNYAIVAEGLNVERQEMRKVTILYFNKGVPSLVITADRAVWDTHSGTWQAPGASMEIIQSNTPATGLSFYPEHPGSSFTVQTQLLQIKESPFDLSASKKKTEEYTSEEMKKLIAHIRVIGDTKEQSIAFWQTRIVQRYAVPFTCLIFAMIGAPLGLRHHRTSSAVGLGVSLIVIFVYYFISVYMSTFGESGRLSPVVAAWMPNILGAILGVILIVRANR